MHFITNQLNQFLRNSFELTEDIVVLSNLVDSDGSALALVNNKVVIFVANMEKDTMPVRQQQSSTLNQRIAITNDPIYLNLSIVIAANFTAKNYLESLKFISSVISYFQSQPVFDHSNSPDLDPCIQKLILDIENIERSELSNMWGMFGSKYIPSIVYRMRTIALGRSDLQTQVSPVNQSHLDIGGS